MFSSRVKMVRTTLFAAFMAAAFSAPPVTAQVKVIGAAGDSITVGFNAVRIGKNPQYSWSTGDAPEVKSHLTRLGQMTGLPVVGYNVAVAGAVAADLELQISSLANRRPDYTTVTIGANDICGWSQEFAGDALHFDTTMRRAVQRLKSINPSMTILLSPIPDMYNLRELSVRRVGCQAVWNLFGICPDLLGRRRTPAERQAFMMRWETANEIIHQIALDHPENVIHNPDLAYVDFDWDHISGVDCYHPSPVGQALYAERTWELFISARP